MFQSQILTTSSVLTVTKLTPLFIDQNNSGIILQILVQFDDRLPPQRTGLLLMVGLLQLLLRLLVVHWVSLITELILLIVRQLVEIIALLGLG